MPSQIEPTTESSIAPPAIMDSGMTSIQPGGGFCMRLELAWGTIRRWYLRKFRPGYVARMQQLRQRDPRGCPHPVLDPRDLKFYRHLTGDCWAPEDDPFAWRDRLPVARAGLAELICLGGGSLVAAVLLAWWYWPLAIVPAVLAIFIASFFRNPRRVPRCEPGDVVAPADGKIVGIEQITDSWVGGPAVRISIFLSIFNVHINRAPLEGRVVGVEYSPGKFLNALRPRSSRENERVTVRLQQVAAPHRRMIVRQIAGAIARRIVCWVYLGEQLKQGAAFGMIKFGSRTELVLPNEPQLRLCVEVGDNVRAGTTVLAHYDPPTGTPNDAEAR